MGYYDGVGTGREASAYELAVATDTPVILVVDGRGAGLSLAAVLQGLDAFRPDSHVAGFIVNRIKPMVYEHFKSSWEAASGLKLLAVSRTCRTAPFPAAIWAWSRPGKLPTSRKP